MSRLVPYSGGSPAAVTAASSGTLPHTPPLDRIEAIAKYVPAEILAFYVPVVPTITMLRHHQEWIPGLQWGAFFLAWVLVPTYFWRIGSGDDRRMFQVIVSTIAFPVWAYVTNRTIGPLAPWYDDALGVVLMLVFSLATAFVLPNRRAV
ncbi:hypothetical protein [Paraburkholderia tropica]|uniref:hypothetical protein n=1 Tax=Paraburkholderia tropica TaxID=92647 RepID=UPI002AB096AF|nr:hypothetical protein [Paraburkholderia tropica]